MSFGKSSSTTTPTLSAEQKADIASSTAFKTGTLIPTYNNIVRGATDVYNQNAGGVLNAAQNQAGYARQAQETLGSTGESALRTGTSGLENLFSPNYEANQIQSALAPAQAQYMQNVAGQRAQFGGTGMLGSARQALADRQLAGQTQAAQMQTAAQVQRDIAGQRAGVGQFLAGQGAANIGQGLGAAGNATSAAFIPQDFFNKYASVPFGTPAGSYTNDYRGTIGGNTSGYKAGLDFGIKLPGQ